MGAKLDAMKNAAKAKPVPNVLVAQQPGAITLACAPMEVVTPTPPDPTNSATSLRKARKKPAEAKSPDPRREDQRMEQMGRYPAGTTIEDFRWDGQRWYGVLVFPVEGGGVVRIAEDSKAVHKLLCKFYGRYLAWLQEIAAKIV